MTEYMLGVMSSLFVFSLVILTVLWCWFQWKYRVLLRAAAKLPVTFPSWPILGHSYLMLWDLEAATANLMEMLRRAVARDLKTVCFWVGPLPYFVANSVEDIQLILNSSNTLDKGEEYEFLKMGLETGVGPFTYSMVTAPGPVWRVTRRHVNSLFVKRSLELMAPVFNRNSRELVASLSQHVGCGRLNIMDPILDTSLKTICNLLFGPEVEIDYKSKEFQGLKNVIERIPEIFIKRMTQPWLRIDSVFSFLYQKELQEVNTLWQNFIECPLKVTKEKCKRRMEKMTKGHDDDVESEEEEELPNIVSVFDILRHKHPEFTEADMRGEMFTLCETGSDTVAAMTSFCLMSLAQYPDIQERLYSEISSVVGADDDVIFDDLNRMPYLEQVLKETLRRFSLVPFLLRRTAEDMKLGSCTIPAGNTVVLALIGIHMNPTIYPDPYKFDPERFSPENMGGRERFAYLPFSGGVRDCIGKRYAMYLMKIIIVHILRTFRLRTVVDVNKIKRRYLVALVSAEGYYVALEHRYRRSDGSGTADLSKRKGWNTDTLETTCVRGSPEMVERERA